jgi:hypothetical protein
VFPGDASRARYVLRHHRRDLVASGAIVRIGRQLVFMGAAYNAWLARHANRVEGYTLPMNGQRG